MTARQVFGLVEFPGGNGAPCVGARVSAALYSAGSIANDAVSGDVVIGHTATLTNSGGQWALALEPNANITPAGTAWQITIAPPGFSPTVVYVEVPDSDGSHNIADIVVDQPTSVPSSALQSHINSYHHRTHVRAYGASGDGVTDDTAAVQAALNATGSLVFDGTYKVGPLSTTGKTLDIWFTAGSSLSFAHTTATSLTITGCSGSIHGLTVTDVAGSGGTYASVLLDECSDLTVSRLTVNGGKALPVAVIDCDNTHIVNGVGQGSVSNRPFAWWMAGSLRSSFDRCRLDTYQYGFTLVGPGYKSGSETSFMTSRPWRETVGMRATGCYVNDHTGHAFNMNGTAACTFEDCVANGYTGVAGNASFQVKQSLNIVSESTEDTFANRVVCCTAIDGVGGFQAQEGTNVLLRDFTVINCKRNPVVLNSTPRSRVDGLTVIDWGTDLGTWALINDDTTCAAVTIQQGSQYAQVDRLMLSLTSDAAYVPSLSAVIVKATDCRVGACFVRRASGAVNTLSRALHIVEARCSVDASFRPRSQYGSAIVDESTSTMYPLTFFANVDLAATGTVLTGGYPTQGMHVGVVRAVESTAASGTPTYAVGHSGSTSSVFSGRSAATEVVAVTGKTIAAGSIPAVTVGGSGAGKLSVAICGVHLS